METTSGDDNDETWRTVLNCILAVVTLTMSVVSVAFVCAISTTRRFTFNLYIIFMLIPDILFNGMEGIRCVYQIASGGSIPAPFCGLRNFQILFYYFGNTYMNVVVAYEIYRLVVSSYHRQKTRAPSTTRVLWQVAAVYVFAGALAAWFVAPVPWAVLTGQTNSHCTPAFGSQLIPEWAAVVIAMLPTIPPFVYVLWVAYKIHANKLLPIQGRTRAIAMYFLRIVVVFVTFYIPIATVAMINIWGSGSEAYRDSTTQVVVVAIFTSLNPIQNVVTIYFLLQKDDIQIALQTFGRRILPHCLARRLLLGRYSEWRKSDKYEYGTTTRVTPSPRRSLPRTPLTSDAPTSRAEDTEQVPDDGSANAIAVAIAPIPVTTASNTSGRGWWNMVTLPDNIRSEWNVEDEYEVVDPKSGNRDGDGDIEGNDNNDESVAVDDDSVVVRRKSGDNSNNNSSSNNSNRGGGGGIHWKLLPSRRNSSSEFRVLRKDGGNTHTNTNTASTTTTRRNSDFATTSRRKTFHNGSGSAEWKMITRRRRRNSEFNMDDVYDWAAAAAEEEEEEVKDAEAAVSPEAAPKAETTTPNSHQETAESNSKSN